MAHPLGDPLKGRHIVLGVSGGIAAYKTPHLVREIIRAGGEVRVVMTAAAREFVTPMTLQTVSGHAVYSDMFTLLNDGEYDVEHVSLADWADLVVVAPATADTLARLAGGFADDPLGATVLASMAPLLVCPSMNVNMYDHPATRQNLATLAARGADVLEPASGELACGWDGRGRLPEPGRIADEIRRLLSPDDLKDTRVLITAGPTCEDLDPVRFLTNRSTGRMGAALAEAAALRGADVTVISGPVQVGYAPWVEVVDVRSAADMLTAVETRLEHQDVLIMSAAVADYRPEACAPEKIKKGQMERLILARTADILGAIRERKDNCLFVGFAAETGEVEARGAEKLARKGLDLVVANRVGAQGTGFAADTNSGVILGAAGVRESFDTLDKRALAWRILDHVRNLR